MTDRKATAIADALARQEKLYRKAIDRLRELASEEAENEVYDITFTLREAITLVGCLRRLSEGRTVRELHQAFGAPGDFGYENPIGSALDKLYRGEP